MPRYYFDIQDGVELLRDSEGSEHLNLGAAQNEATDTLTQMGKEIFPGHADRALSIDIRDDDGKALMRVTLTHSTERFGQAAVKPDGHDTVRIHTNDLK
jgi:hypothetical protein